MNTKFPLQPIKDGRFIQNRIVSMLLDTHPTMDLNTIACGDFTTEEHEQFSQLIGYSLNGFSELSYVSNELYLAAINVCETGNSELEARNIILRQQLRDASVGIKIAATSIFGIHPDDLGEL